MCVIRGLGEGVGLVSDNRLWQRERSVGPRGNLGKQEQKYEFRNGYEY